MDDFDQDRHDKFKKYEMHKKMREDSKLAGMTPEEQVMERKRLEDLQAKHDDHDKINYPGHKKQMEEIWEEDDEMKDEEFEPKAFFSLHDTNSDGFWDIYEVEIMMNHELKKAWDEDNEEDDMVEMEEERLRMREEFMKNADSNKDKMISRAEWLKYAEGDEFSKEDDWDTVDDMVKNEKVYSAEELKDYKEYIEEFEADFKKKFVELIETSDKLTEKKDEHVKLQGTVNRNGLSHEILDTHRDKISEKQEVLDGLAQEVRDMAKTLTDMNIDFQDMSDSGKEAYEKKLDQVEAQQKKMLARAERKINEIMEVHKGSETEL